jgi:ech hydrogenase subunit E
MAQRTVAPFGPQHPVLPEPIQLQITYEDEKVVDVAPALGYGHRGIEKACEINEYPKNIHLIERICGICSCIHGISYCETVERLWPMEVPPRAKYLRVIYSELSRIHSHLLWLGLLCDALGFESMFMQFWRIRERVLDLLEMTSGTRVTHSVSVVGGVRRDIDDEQEKIIIKEIQEVRKEAEALINVLVTDPTVKARTVGKGVLTKEQAILLGTNGPHLRASGVKEDCRMLGMQVYDELGFEPIVETAGDSYARALVRARETLQAIDLILEAFSKMPKGEIFERPKGRPPANEVSYRAEQCRGECFYYAKGNGTQYLDRFRVRTPTFSNIPSLLVMLPGSELADVPIIVLSIDPCISCTER